MVAGAGAVKLDFGAPAVPFGASGFARGAPVPLGPVVVAGSGAVTVPVGAVGAAVGALVGTFAGDMF